MTEERMEERVPAWRIHVESVLANAKESVATAEWALRLSRDPAFLRALKDAELPANRDALLADPAAYFHRQNVHIPPRGEAAANAQKIVVIWYSDDGHWYIKGTYDKGEWKVEFGYVA